MKKEALFENNTRINNFTKYLRIQMHEDKNMIYFKPAFLAWTT